MQEAQKKLWDKIAPEWHEFKTTPAKHVMEFLKNTHGKVLDHGSGSGRHLTKIKNGKMYLVDFSKKMLELAKKKAKEKNIPAEFINSELTFLPFDDNFFDYAISISSIHCIKGKENREKAIKELYRVLKPKAKALIGVWNHCSKRFKNAPKEKYIAWRDKGKRYYYLYNEEEIHEEFQKAGFKITQTLNSEMMINFIVEK